MKSRTILFGVIVTFSIGIALFLIRSHRGAGTIPSVSTTTAPDAPLIRNQGRLVVPEQSALRKYLQIGKAQQKYIQTPLTTPAVIEADPARVAKILPPLPGKVISLLVRLGDSVNAGQPLLILDSPDMAQARSDFRHAKVTLALARRTKERQEDLGGHGIAAKSDVEQAQTAYAGAQSDYQRAEARLLELGVAPGSTDSLHVTVRSPVTGRVTDLNVVPGAYVNDNTAALITVADLSSVWFAANVQEKDLGAVYVGEEITATLTSYPGETFRGKVLIVGDILDPDTRTVKVRIKADNADHRLKPGMFANVTFLGHPHLATAVPMTALVQGEDKTLVFVETQPWEFEARPVLLGARAGNTIEIRSGLKSGERIITQNGVLLNNNL